MANKFKGELNWINPKLLVTENEHNKTECFFLVLCVVFNDLKGLILFEKMLRDIYEKPQSNEVTSHAGNYEGVIVQIQKLILSTINEFFIFLKKNSDVFTESEFKQTLGRLPKLKRQFWGGMIAAAHGKQPNAVDLLKTIVQVRSNIAFHYDHSRKILRNGYISWFFRKEQDDRNRLAYYSIGDTIELTRFYFSDAAVGESIWIAAGKKPKEPAVGDISLLKFQKQVMETINVMSMTISSLLKNYIQLRRNRPH